MLDQIADTDFNGRVALNGGRMADGTVAVNNLTVSGKPTVDTNEVDDPSTNFIYHGGVYGTINRSGNGTVMIDGVSLELRNGYNLTGIQVGGNWYCTPKDQILVGATGLIAGPDVKLRARTVFALNDNTEKITIYGETYSICRRANGNIYQIVDADGHAWDALYGETFDFASTTSITLDRYYSILSDGTVYSEVSHANTALGVLTGATVVCGYIKLTNGNLSVSDAFQHARRNLTFSDSVALQVGSRSKDIVNFTFEYVTSGMGDLTSDLDLSARGLGTEQLTLRTAEKANEAIDHIDNAINKTSMIRATFGAMQNRLEYKIESITTNTENIQEAESNIRDTDMAKEMMSFTRYNILQQAAQSMLSQANQQPQSILQLLGG